MRCVSMRQVRPSGVRALEHFAKNIYSAFLGLADRARMIASVIPAILNVHLHEVMPWIGARHRESHVAEMIPRRRDVRSTAKREPSRMRPLASPSSQAL